MSGLTPLGVIHTAISIVAVIAGFIALLRDKRISSGNGLGKLYVITTALTWLTATTETTTRLPLGAPLLPGPDAPQLRAASAALFVLFLFAVRLQVRALRAAGTA